MLKVLQITIYICTFAHHNYYSIYLLKKNMFIFRTHANGSIKRGSKDNATDSLSLRTGIGVQLKDIKVFNRARQQGECS